MYKDPYEHFIKSPAGDIFCGNHLIVDMWGVRHNYSPNQLLEMFENACRDAGATVLSSNCHEFGPDCGATGVVILSESHLSWHDYCEAEYMAVDIFMCGNADPTKALPKIKGFLNPSKTEETLIRRGKVSAQVNNLDNKNIHGE